MSLKMFKKQPNSKQFVHLFLFCHKHDLGNFKIYLQTTDSPVFDDLAIEQFKLPVEHGVKYLSDRLAPALIKAYKNDNGFKNGLLDYCTKHNKYDLLVSPVNLLNMTAVNDLTVQGLF